MSNKPTLIMVLGMILLVTMGISSLIPVLPALAAVFGIPLNESWRMIAAFALPGLICTPFVGLLADRFGRKTVLIPALVVFMLGSTACAFARTYPEFLVCRMVQGAGSAPLGLLYTTIIADTWSGRDRIRAMSFASMALGAGTALSPAAGGALGMVSWRLPFFLSLLAVPVLLLALRVPLMAPGKKTAFKRYAADLARTVGSRQTLVMLALTLLTFIMLSGPIITCFPILSAGIFKATSLQTGVILAVSSLASGAAAVALPALYGRFSTRALLLASFALYTLSLCAIALTPSLWLLIPPMCVFGLAQGLNIPLISVLLAGQAPPEQRSSLMAVNAILLRLGQNMGPAGFGSLAALIGPGGAIASGSAIAAVMAFLVLSTPLPSPLPDGQREAAAGLEVIPEK